MDKVSKFKDIYTVTFTQSDHVQQNKQKHQLPNIIESFILKASLKASLRYKQI